MRNSILTLLGLTLIAAALLSACKRAWGKPDTEIVEQKTIKIMDSTALVARGRYLVNSIGCADCHSPKRMTAHGPEVIPELHLSGFPSDGTVPPLDMTAVNNGWIMFSPDGTSSVGPWGQSYAANITGDETGIGNWTEENFIRSIRQGKYKGLESSRDLLPLMPWHYYRNLTNEDLRSIYYYLKTTPPVDNIVPAPRTVEQLQ